MDASTGRFLTEDTSWGESESPLSENLYTYCENDPIQYTDPTGHKALLTNMTSAQLNTYFHSTSGYAENNAIAQSYGYSSALAMVGAYATAEAIPHTSSGVTVTAQQVNTAINQGSTAIYYAINGSSSSVQAAATLAIANGITVPYVSGTTPQSPVPQQIAQLQQSIPTPQKVEEVIKTVVASNPQTEEQMHVTSMAGNSANVQDFSFPYELNYNDPEYARKYHDLTVVLQKYLIDRGNLYGFEGSPYSSLLKWNIDISYAAYIDAGVDSRDQLGYYGLRTRNAVKWFQKEVMHMQNPDGIVGPETWHAMGLPEPGSDMYSWMLSANGKGWDATKTAWNDYYQSPESSATLTWASLTLSHTVASSNGSAPTPTPHSAAEAAQYLAAQTKTGGMDYSNYNVSLEAALDEQMKQSPQIEKNGRWVNATKDEVMQYLNPNNYNEGVSKYQFLDLSASAGISEEDMANFLSGKGILSGNAKIYLEAAMKYKVSEVYLAAHSALETGNGTSTLAKGVIVNGVTVYNMYGIGAIDSDPIGGGSQYAYKMGWTTPQKAIEGGAKWISEQFINNVSYKQNTLYKMRWNPASSGEHQYATDIGWAVKQTSNIKRMYDSFSNASLKFDVPIYN